MEKQLSLVKLMRFFCVLVALMILTATYPAYAKEAAPEKGQMPAEEKAIGISTPSDLQPDLTIKTPPNTTTILPQEAEKEFSSQLTQPFPGPMCSKNFLSDIEANNIFNLLKGGFVGDEISGDAKPEETEKFRLGDEKRTELPHNKIVIENPSNPLQAAQATLSNKEIEPYEVSNWINSYLKGPFAFGLVLSDTVRTGRCADANTLDCFLVGKNLKFRNSGSGIIANARPFKELGAGAVEKIKGLFTPNKEGESLKFSDEEQEIIGAGLFNDIEDELTIKTAQRIEKEIVANSMFTKEFSAKIGTNCVSDDCIISTYSLFDKYFNQWMSSEMVATTFGPSLLYRSKKLFGWVGRRASFLRGGWDNFADKFKANFETPGSILGDIKLNRMGQRIDKQGWRDWWQSMTIGNTDGTGYPLIKTQEFYDWWGKQQVKGGFLDSINTVEKKAEFMRVLKDLRTYIRAGETQVAKAEGRYKGMVEDLLSKGVANPYEHPEVKRSLVDYGREFGKWIQSMDDEIGVDGPDWFVRHPNMGFYNKGVRQVNTNEVIDLFQEHRNARVIIDKFVDSGNWKNFENEAFLYRGAYETDGAGNLLLYGFDNATGKKIGEIDYDSIGSSAKTINNLWAKTDHGEMMRLNPNSTNFVKARSSKNIDVFQGDWAPIKSISPEEFSLRLTNPRVRSNYQKAVGNVEKMLDTVKERNWVSRRYTNALDKLMAQEDELIKSYFTVKGGLKWTAYPFGYWWVKKGAGIKGISFYQLPDTWSYILINHGDEKIFDYSYIDFFANAGSDQGDIFVQVLNKLPWKLILDELSNQFEPTKNLFDKITGKEIRNEVENLAFYMTGPPQCANCFLKIETDGNNFENFRPFFVTKNTKLSSYLLEDTQSTKAREKGQTLVAFGHKTNLSGKTGDIEGEKIDLVEAIRNESKPEPKAGSDKQKPDLEEKVESCKEAIRSMPGYTSLKKIIPFLPEDSKIAAVLGGVQSLTYVTFFWPGIFSTVLVQTLYAPKLQDCVDTDEGYFVHYFLATKKDEPKEKGNKVELSTEKVSNLISNLKDTVTGSFSGDQNSLGKVASGQVGKEINTFLGNAEENRVVQAKLDVFGTTAGQFKGVRLFYFWCGKGCEKLAGEYRVAGREILGDKNSNDSTVFDFEKGVLSKNGEPIVSNEDAVRLAGTNLAGPHQFIPRRLYTMCIEPSNEVGIEIQANGVASMRSIDVQGCISDAVVAQTGLPLVSLNDLSSTFGLVQTVSTVTHPNISFLGDQIIAEGIPRKIADGAGASLKILNNRKARLSHSNDGVTDVGTVKAIQFENGQLIAKPDGCYAVYLRHHQDAILNQEDVENLKPRLTESINPENDCAEPAIDLSTVANPQSSFLRGKIENFNTSLEKLGPFQVFETPTKRFILSSERDSTGACQDHLRVIDKETGKIEDFVGKATQTPTGIDFLTDDGQTKSLGFGVENGVPQVSIDNKKPETLLNAQGRNGAFYYDPNSGLWYAENAQLLPLIKAFRDGISTKVGPDNTTTSTASGNELVLNFADDKGGLLNLPSLPQNNFVLLLFIAGLIATFVIARVRFRKKNES